MLFNRCVAHRKGCYLTEYVANGRDVSYQNVWPIGRMVFTRCVANWKNGIYQMCGQWEDDINKLFDKWDNYLTECVMCIANGMLR